MNAGVGAEATHAFYCNEREKKSIKEEGTRKKRRKKGSGQLQTTGELEERRRISTFNNVLPREPTLCLCPRERKKESFI